MCFCGIIIIDFKITFVVNCFCEFHVIGMEEELTSFSQKNPLFFLLNML